jgi:hypothetical protein
MRMITMADCFYLVSFTKWDFECGQIKWIIPLTSDDIKQLSLH